MVFPEAVFAPAEPGGEGLEVDKQTAPFLLFYASAEAS